MRYPLLLTLAGLSALLVADLGADAQAETYSARQYYGAYAKHPKHSYTYRTYYYKPTPTYSGYKHHYAIYYPSKPKYVYYYNPYKKQYWGRCPSNTNGKPLYSLLAEKDRKGNIEDIDESAFPEPTDVPPLPDSTDGVKLDLPPDDLPTTVGLPG